MMIAIVLVLENPYPSQFPVMSPYSGPVDNNGNSSESDESRESEQV